MGKWHFACQAAMRGRHGNLRRFELPLPGKHNIYNALIAIAVARQFDIDFSTIAKRIKSYRQTCPKRLEFKKIRGVEILDDSYNSNPISMECAIGALHERATDGKKIIISGDMLELGRKARAMHKNVGSLVASGPIDALITLGGLSKFMHKEAKKKGMKSIYHARSHSDAAEFLRRLARPGDVVLVKGSRRMEMERVIEEFKKK